MRACFDAAGFLLWATPGPIFHDVPAGASTHEVEGRPASLFLDRVSGKVVKARAAPIAADRTTVLVGDAGARLTVPDPCWLLVDGARTRVTGGSYLVKLVRAGSVRVELTGPHRSDPVTITAMTLVDAEADLIAQVKAEAERRKMLVASPGGYKKMEYAGKESEVRTYRSLGGTVTAILSVLGGWTAERKAQVFPWATASAAAFGDTLPAAIARFESGIARAAAGPTIGAAEEKACAAIRAATTLAAKQAAFSQVRWPE